MRISYRILNYGLEFKQWARENGIRDPFHAELALIKINEDGVTNIEIEEDENGNIKLINNPLVPSDEEKRNWNKMEREYISRRCFEEIGYEAFLERAPKDIIERDEFVPCRSADRQCRFDCYRFIDCAVNKIWRPE